MSPAAGRAAAKTCRYVFILVVLRAPKLQQWHIERLACSLGKTRRLECPILVCADSAPQESMHAVGRASAWERYAATHILPLAVSAWQGKVVGCIRLPVYWCRQRQRPQYGEPLRFCTPCTEACDAVDEGLHESTSCKAPRAKSARYNVLGGWTKPSLGLKVLRTRRSHGLACSL